MVISIGKYSIKIGSWNELTRQQLLQFCRVNYSNSNPFDLKVKLLVNFFGLIPLQKKTITIDNELNYWFIKGWKRILLSISQIHVASEAILSTFYRKNRDGNYEFDCFLSKNIIGSFRAKFCKHCGPVDGLTNITFREFIYADTFYIDYATTQSIDALNKLIGLLFRPKRRFLWLLKRKNNYNGDSRIRFNDFHIDRLATQVKNIDPALKQAIIYFYIGCRRFISIRFPEIFTGGSDSNEKLDTFKMYLKITDILAQGNPINKEAIRDQQLYDVLDSLNNYLTKPVK
jgi:hypothetical protein